MFCFVAFYWFPPPHPPPQYLEKPCVYVHTDNCNTHNCVWPFIILIQMILCILRSVTLLFSVQLSSLWFVSSVSYS